MRRLVLTIFAALSVTLAAGPVLAQPSARDLFFQGQAAYESGEFQSAVDSWEAAYAQDPRPLLQFNIAQAYERLGQLQNAITAYEIFIRDGSGDRLATAQARLVALRRRLDATGVQLNGGPDGAIVRIDGDDVGRLPRPDPFRVEPGPHRIVVEADGYESFDSVIAVGDGQVVQVPVQMNARSTAVVGAGSGSQSSGGEAGPSDAVGGGGPSMIGVILTIAGGAILAGGAVTGILALTAANNSVNGEDGSADDARTFALLTDILIPTGAVVAAVGVVLMLVLKDGGSDEEPAVAPLLAPDFLGLAAQGRF